MIFITGCNGLVGSFIARRFLQAGHTIRALKRQNSNLDYLADIKDQIEWVEGDILDVSRLSDVMQGVSQVVHSAALVSFSSKTKEKMYKVNVEGTANIVNLSLDLGIKKLAFISSVAALGRKKNSEIITEKSEWEPSKFNTHYAETKHLAEMEVWRGHVEGLNTVIVNPSVVLGPGAWERSSTQLFKYVWDEKKFYATGSLNYVDVRDLSEIVFRLLTGNYNGERYIVNAGNMSYKDLFEEVSQVFKRQAPGIKVTPFIAALAWRLALLQSFITRKPPFITKETAYMSQKHFYYKSDKLIEALNFNFRSFQESVHWTCQELATHNHLEIK